MANVDITYKLRLPSGSAQLSDRIVTIEKVDYLMVRPPKGNKGGNSWIFLLYDMGQNEIEEGEVLPEVPDLVMKINKYSLDDNRTIAIARNNRFKQEIDALFACKEERFVINIFHNGTIIDAESKRYQFYTMEYAEYDLKSYMETKVEGFTKSQKLSICIKLAQSLESLNSMDYYHRDIKPDNFFLTTENEWKIGDLGLVAKRNTPNEIDEEQEYIGPKGWTSPEVMNKVLTTEQNTRFDRIIDDKSDIFQLGLVLWYVMQGNAPIGCIMENDFLEKDHSLYILIRTMVSYPKGLRPQSFTQIVSRLKEIATNELISK